MKKIVLITIVLLVFGVLGVLIFIVFWRPPMPTPIEHLTPISLEGYDLPEDVSIPGAPTFEDKIIEVDGAIIPVEVHSPEDAVLALMCVRSYYGIEPDSPEFICVRDETGNNDLRVFELQQLHKGVPVKRGEIRDVTIRVYVFSKTGKVESVRGSYQPGLNLDVTPEISVDKAKKSFSLKFGEWIDTVQLTIFNGKLCWRFNVKGRKQSSYCYIYVSAKSGEIVLKQSTVIS